MMDRDFRCIEKYRLGRVGLGTFRFVFLPIYFPIPNFPPPFFFFALPSFICFLSISLSQQYCKLLSILVGTVWSIDVSYNSDLCLTGSADNSSGLWDVSNGRLLYQLPTLSPVRTCCFSYDSQRLFFSTDKALRQPCTLQIFPLAKIHQEGCILTSYYIYTRERVCVSECVCVCVCV